MSTYNITLSATYTINAMGEEEAMGKARARAELSDMYAYSEEIEFDPEFTD